MSTRSRIHPSAIVEDGAELGPDVEVGPYAFVGAGAKIGARSKLAAHAFVAPFVTMGEANYVHPFAVIGTDPQIKKRDVEAVQARGAVVIGDRNVFREHVTVNRGSDTPTTIGSDNLFMAGAHVAHDVTLGSHCVLANATQIAGHVAVASYATFGGLSAVAQFGSIGESAFVAGGAMVEREVPPFVIVQGDRARVRALNKVGLTRRGVPDASIALLTRVFRGIYAGNTPRTRAIDAACAQFAGIDPWVDLFLAGLTA